MQPIWAPWRMEFIRAAKPDGCIFCDFPAQGPSKDRENLIVHRSERAFTILNRFPYNNGHLLVAPREHKGRPDQLTPDELLDLRAGREHEAVVRLLG